MKEWILVSMLVLSLVGSGAVAKNAPDRPDTWELYSSMWVLYRDAYGVPQLDENGCEQPIAAGIIDDLPSEYDVFNEDGIKVSRIPVIYTEEGECRVDPNYEEYLQLVVLDRLNRGRSPLANLDSQLVDAASILFAVDVLSIERDGVGRLVALFPGEEGEIEGLVLEQPGYNLAIHKDLLMNGFGGVLLDLSYYFPQSEIWDLAAATFGAAADPGTKIGVDLVVYSNFIYGIAQGTTWAPTIKTEEDEKFIDYSGYSYQRSAVFPGCVRGYLADLPETGMFTYFEGTIADCVFGGDIVYDPVNEIGICSGGVDFSDSSVHAFAHRADDTRAVSAFVRANAIASSTAILDPSVAGIDVVGSAEVCSYLGE